MHGVAEPDPERVDRIAVDVGAGGTRVAAGSRGRGGTQLLGVLPAGTPPDAALATLLGRDAGRWRVVPTAHAVRGALGLPGSWVVVDAGARGTRISGQAGRRSVPVGGDALDRAVLDLLPTLPEHPRDLRLLRETLSLRPAASLMAGGRRRTVEARAVRAAIAPGLREIVAAVRDVAGRERVAGVVLAGGLARTPLLASLVDEAVRGLAVLVPARPELVGVLGAAACTPPAGDAGAYEPPPGGRCRDGVLVTEPWPVAMPPVPSLPPPRPRARWRTAAAAAVGTLTAAGLWAAGQALPVPVEQPAGGAVLAQYGYRFTLPPGWEHGGGEPARRRTLLTPVGAPDGVGLIAVERTPLGFDAGLEPARAVAELRAQVAAAGFDGLRTGERAGGREVLRFRQPQRLGHGSAEVDWFVLFEGTDQLSVGCRRPPGGSVAVSAACELVLRTLARS